MTRLERTVAVNTGVVGLLLIVVVVALDSAGLLRQPEDWLYDLRARHFQYFQKDPTDRLVHVDIDDRAEQVLGRWPWPRSLLAELLDEIRLAGASVVGLDVLFTEPQDTTYDVEPVPFKADEWRGRAIKNDELLATSIDQLDRCIVPASVGESFQPVRRDPLTAAGIDMLSGDPELTEAEVVADLRRRGFGPGDLESLVAGRFLAWRRDAVLERVAREMGEGTLTPEELRGRLLRRSDSSLNSPLAKLIGNAAVLHEARHAVRSRIPECPPGTLGSLLPVDIALAPIAEFSRAATATAFVDYPSSSDGKLRSVPLLLEYEGRILPQMGLTLALEALGADLRDVRRTRNSVVVTKPDKSTVTVPVRTMDSAALGREVPTMFDIPWFGPPDWKRMYERPGKRRDVHLSMNAVWEPIRMRRLIEANNEAADSAVKGVIQHLEPPNAEGRESPKIQRLLDNPIPVDRVEAWYDVIDDALRAAGPRLALYAASPPLNGDEADAAFHFLVQVRALRRIREQNPQLVELIATQRRSLAEALAGRAVLIGAASTGRLDVVTTSIHAICPGVVAHGVIFNAIMTGEFWRQLPWGFTALATVVCGVASGLLVTWLPPTRALAAVVVLAVLYVLFNGLYLFDHGNRLLGVAAPLLALGLVWAGASVTRMIIETGERRRVTARFSQYVDPLLVQYTLERPDQVRLEGETRELTVCFTDMVGFTTLAELLGEKSVALLNEYMGRMVPIIRSERGYLNKFLGDGIMFFFGAPMPDPAHALQAVTTALRMIAAMGPLNEKLTRESLPTVSMRVGISTGSMVVGDAGSDDASDYTVLGDAVNLGARLESVNKRTGTTILMTENTRKQIGERFLVRPIGKIQVVGKSEGVVVYEPLAFVEDATPRLRRLAELSTELVEHFQAERFGDCLLTAERFEAEFGPNPLARLYREQCQAHTGSPRTTSFDGRIVITEK